MSCSDLRSSDCLSGGRDSMARMRFSTLSRCCGGRVLNWFNRLTRCCCWSGVSCLNSGSLASAFCCCSGGILRCSRSHFPGRGCLLFCACCPRSRSRFWALNPAGRHNEPTSKSTAPSWPLNFISSQDIYHRGHRVTRRNWKAWSCSPAFFLCALCVLCGYKKLLLFAHGRLRTRSVVIVELLQFVEHLLILIERLQIDHRTRLIDRHRPRGPVHANPKTIHATADRQQRGKCYRGRRFP